VPPRSSEAFVLDAVALRERDKLVTLFTETEGKVRGVAHGAARSVKRFGGRLERLSRVRASYFEKEGQDLVRLDDLELVEESFRLQQDLVVAAALAYVSEVAGEFVREKESDQRYYRLLGATLDAFRAGVGAAVALRYFEYWTARLHGIFPELEACDLCRGEFTDAGARVLVADGTGMCSGCSRGAGGRSLPLSRSALGVIDAFRRSKPSALLNVALPAPALREVEAAAGGALVSFTGRPFRSSDFLRQVLPEGAR
jgi:DNA repair protein RecO (recombination protein O)